MNEDALIRAAQEGDQDAFLRLLEQHDRAVIGVIDRFTADAFVYGDDYLEDLLDQEDNPLCSELIMELIDINRPS